MVYTMVSLVKWPIDKGKTPHKWLYPFCFKKIVLK